MLDREKRQVRYQPCMTLSNAERFRQAETLCKRTWTLLRELGIDPGPLPTCLVVFADAKTVHVRLLESLTKLLAEVYATYVIFGVQSSLSSAFYEFTKEPLKVNFQTIIDDSSADEDFIIPAD